MMTNRGASDGPAGQTVTTAGALPDSEGGDGGAGITTAGQRRKELAWLLVALVPLSAALAFVVLQVMASASAAATGGCGGG
jgi:hypothetical protein